MEGGLLSLKWNNHRSSFIHVLSSLRKKDSFCDVTLACDGKFYPSHKLVLSTCSEYFQEMFHHTQCKHPVIVLKDIRCEDLEALLNYMYVGEVNVVQEKLSTLIKAAECLKIKGLAVPDDPPKESYSEKRGSGHHDSAPESKRRRTDPEHHRNKESSRSFSKHSPKSSTSDVHYKQSGPSQESFHSFGNQPENNTNPGSYTFDNGNLKNKEREREGVFIKQEPPDNFVDVIDSKEGILQKTSPTFLNPLPREDISNTEAMGSSESQEHWGTESRTEDNYPPLDPEGNESTNEDCSQNENVWDEEWQIETQMNQREMHGKNKVWNPEFPSPSSSTLSDPLLNRKVYECPMCPKMFPHKGNYKKHLQTHTGERPFACSYCSYRATQKIHVLVHMKKMHKQYIA